MAPRKAKNDKRKGMAIRIVEGGQRASLPFLDFEKIPHMHSMMR
jgi:hypothetical protein